MNNIAKLIASIAALIAALTLAWMAYSTTNYGKDLPKIRVVHLYYPFQ